MRKKEAIIITIGEKGAILTIHKRKEIVSKVFFENFDEEVEGSIKKILSKYKAYNIYLILDTLDQVFKKKDYPSMKKGDLEVLIKRELNNDSDKDSLRNYVILDKIKSNSTIKSWQVLFIYATLSPQIKDILRFIYNLPNSLIGIYLAPIESVQLINSINTQESKSNSRIDCLVTQTKVSGIRQTIYHKNQILFTRLLDYDSSNPDFLKKYEKDLYANFEYLRRIFPEISIKNFYITNILSQNSIKIIEGIKNIEFNISNYTPHNIAESINEYFTVKKNTKNSDIILSKSFFESKKQTLAFATEEITKLRKTYFFMRSSYFLNLLILLAIGVLCLSSISKISESEEMVNVVKIERLNSLNELSFSKKILLSKEAELSTKYNNQADGTKIIEVGEINEIFKNINDTPFKEYQKLYFIKEYDLIIMSKSYKVKKFNSMMNGKIQYSVNLKTQIINKSGDVDELFAKYDKLKLAVQKEYKGRKVSMTKLPRNINLAKKYHNFNIEINIDSKK